MITLHLAFSVEFSLNSSEKLTVSDDKFSMSHEANMSSLMGLINKSLFNHSSNLCGNF